MLQNNDTAQHNYDVGELLAAEYAYIAGTAFQANEDRARVSQFFFITFGTFIAALFSSQTNIDKMQLYLAFALVFSALTILGALTIMQLARLRLTWRASAIAMNQIKNEVVREHSYLKPYFLWTSKTLPKKFKLNSIGFYLATSVSILSSSAFGAAIAFGSLAAGSPATPWSGTIVGALIVFKLFLVLYRWLLR